MDLWESAACTKTERNGTRHVCIGPLSEKELSKSTLTGEVYKRQAVERIMIMRQGRRTEDK